MIDHRLLDLATAFGMVLRARRKAAGMSQRDVAEAAGVSRPNYSRHERGFHDPQVSSVAKFAQALGMEPEDFFTEMIRVAKERAS